MARARNIKPGFFKNYELADMGPYAQILFSGLWCLADREGRLEDKPRFIKAEIFPYYDCDVNGELTKLEQLKLVDRYEVDGVAVIQVCNFKKHQTPHNTEKASTLPAKPAANPHAGTTSVINGALTVDSRKSNGGNPPDSLIPDSLSTDSGLSDSKPAARGGEYSEEFEQAWAIYPSRPGASKKESFQAWTARLKDGVGAEVLIAGVRRYATYVKSMETEPQYVKQPKSFFGPGEHYRSDWTPPPRGSPAYKTAADKSKEVADALTGRTKNDRNESTIIDIN
jgi:hypothetical protein